MEKVDRLTELLQRLNAGEDPASVNREAQEFLASIDTQELSLAEQELIKAGLEPADLRHLCSAHMEMLGGELEKMKPDLQPGHVIHTLTTEHDMILGFLDELEKINQSIQGMESYPSENSELDKLKHIGEHLIEAELHHRREEEALFPALERRGVFGPPQVMRMEHEELRTRKKELGELAETAEQQDFDIFRKRLDAAVRFIVPTLRDHILKENNILYPTALEVIKEDEVWAEMSSECDRIGYCCFTPNV